MKYSKGGIKVIEILRSKNEKSDVDASLDSSIKCGTLNTYKMKDKDNQFLENYEYLTCREFDMYDTIKLLMHPNLSVFWSWGIEKKINYKNKALLLYVNGYIFQGYLAITLSFKDLFDVHFFANGVLKKSITDLYFDQLRDTIDVAVERQDDYKF